MSYEPAVLFRFHYFTCGSALRTGSILTEEMSYLYKHNCNLLIEMNSYIGASDE